MTRAQRRAAQRNAQLSTGPRTPEGKSVSSRNAVRHNLSGTVFVLLPSEDPAAFQALVRDYTKEWNPRTPHETFLVAQMVQARWRLNRIARMEAEVFDAMFYRFGEGQTDEGALVIAEMHNPDAMRRLHRYAQDAERSYSRAVKELRAYRAGRPEGAAASTTCDEIRNEPEPPAATSAAASCRLVSAPDAYALPIEPKSPPTTSKLLDRSIAPLPGGCPHSAD